MSSKTFKLPPNVEALVAANESARLERLRLRSDVQKLVNRVVKAGLDELLVADVLDGQAQALRNAHEQVRREKREASKR